MRRSVLTLALGVVGLLAACQATTGKTVSQAMNDPSITAAVQSKLTADRTSNFTRVDVDTEQGVVQLSGVVKTSEQKTRAEKLAGQVDGVKRVTNNLKIQAAGQ